MNDKLPDGVVLEMVQVDNMTCIGCYFIKDLSKCPDEWSSEEGFTRSCTNKRDIIFREIGESDE